MANKKITDHQHSTSKKKAYTSPTLIHFGTVRELTSGGSSGDDEAMKMMNPTKRS